MLWQLATFLMGAEPWDSSGYIGFYLGALGLSAVFGWIYPKRSWRWGLIIILAQIPVMVSQFMIRGLSFDGLAIVGLAYLAVQTLPAMMVAVGASHFRRSSRKE